MKITAEIEIEYINDEYTFDDYMQEKIVEKVSTTIAKKINEKQSAVVAEAAKKIINAKVEYFINNFLEQPITINEGWNKKTEYPSLYDMIEQQISAVYTGKINGNSQCNEDKFLKTIKDFVQSHVKSMLDKQNFALKKYAEKTTKEEIEKNILIKTLRGVIEQ